MSELAFDGIADFYDLVYAGKDTAAEAAYVADRLGRNGVPAPARVLEWGAGTGRHARALSQSGYTVTGVERSAEMLRRAAAAGEFEAGAESQVQLLQGDLLDPPPGENYDAVLACFHVISYLTDEAMLARAFANARAALRPGGLLLFDVWHGPAVIAQGPQHRSGHYSGGGIELHRVVTPRHDPETHRVDVHYRYFHRRTGEPRWSLAEETHEIRYWFGSEIRRHAEVAGLRCVVAEEWLTGRAPGLDTWGVCHVLCR